MVRLFRFSSRVLLPAVLGICLRFRASTFCRTFFATKSQVQRSRPARYALSNTAEGIDVQTSETSPSTLLSEVLQGLDLAINKTEAKLITLRRQIKDPAEAELWRLRGSSLQTLPRSSWRRGLIEVDVPDYSQLDENGQPMKINVKLDPEVDFQDNAKECFKQAGKIERAIQKCLPFIEAEEKQLETFKSQLPKLRGLQVDIDSVNPSQLDEVQKLYSQLVELKFIRLPEVKPVLSEKEVELQQQRRKYGKDVDRFVSPGGFEVLAGRSASANERVSFELTRPDGWWFHTANGVPGSHVTIKASSSQVSDEDLEFAAGIAAWHSKARDKHYVEVMFCLGEQLRKPQRRKTGQVQVKGSYKSIDVKPQLPPDSTE